MERYSSIIMIALWALIPGFIARKKGRSFWGYFFLSFLITPLFSTIVILCLRKLDGHSTEEIAKTRSSAYNSETGRWPLSYDNGLSDAEKAIIHENELLMEPATQTIRFCRYCGTKLIDGSKFCGNCGNRIEEDQA